MYQTTLSNVIMPSDVMTAKEMKHERRGLRIEICMSSFLPTAVHHWIPKSVLASRMVIRGHQLGQFSYQFIQEPHHSENSTLESTEILPANDNIEQYFLDQSNAEEAANENSGIKWSSLHKNIPSILSFGDPDSPIEIHAVETVTKKPKTGRSRPDWANRDHVLAERKRRGKITENLYELSSLVPDLKKRDKASVLSKTIEYIKQMQEKMKTLEEEIAKKRNATEIPTNKKTKLVSVSSTNENNPKIEIQVFENMFLIKIHCYQASKRTLVKVLTLFESLHMKVVTSNSVQFSEQILDLTITSQVIEDFRRRQLACVASF